MSYLNINIKGIPYGKSKTRGNTFAPKEWTEAIINQTSELTKIKEACILRVTFFLPKDKFPKDFPYGPDLDNLLKRFMDALNETIFSETEGKDSCVISLNVMKTKVDSYDESGALLEVLPVSV